MFKGLSFLKKCSLSVMISFFSFFANATVVETTLAFPDELSEKLLIPKDLPDFFQSVTFEGISNKEFLHSKILELKRRVADLLICRLGIADNNSSDAMVLHWLSGVLLYAINEDNAVLLWQSLPERYKRSVQDFSPEHHFLFSLSPAKIVLLYNQVQQLKRNDLDITFEILKRVNQPDSGSVHLDNLQQQPKPEKRSLAYLKKEGLKIRIEPYMLSFVQEFVNRNGNKILLNELKNRRFFETSGLTNSKTSLMIHDMFDHFWFMSRLEQDGLIERYKQFIASVGNPHQTDIFSREGELFASIAFEFRLYHISSDYKPLYSLEEIRAILKNSLDAGNVSFNQQKAYDLLVDSNNQELLRGLPYIFSGVVIELMEQRRKHGCIKLLNKEGKISGFLYTLDPEYTALIVEGCYLLFIQHQEALRVLLNITVLIEQFLQHPSNNIMVVRLYDIEHFDLNNATISSSKIEWFKQNPGSFATRKIFSYEV